jgi:hypothetical protein
MTHSLAEAPAAGPGIDLSVFATLSAHLGSLAQALQSEQRYRDRCQNAIRLVPLVPQQAVIAGSAFTITGPPDVMGPHTGYVMAIQRLVIGGLGVGSTPDFAKFYRGPSTAAAVSDVNELAAVNGNTPFWHPGRTGCIIQQGDTILAAGTGLTATGTVTLAGEVILMEEWLLPHFLM